MQNLHRYFFFAGLLFNCVPDLRRVRAFQQPGLGWGVTVGTVVLCVNAGCSGRIRSVVTPVATCAAGRKEFSEPTTALPVLEVR